jgi:small subunit ribosomal protein S17e
LEKKRGLAVVILQRHPEAFSVDYEKNKKSLDELAVIPSKQLRNQIAGYIAKSLKADAVEEQETVEEEKAE